MDGLPDYLKSVVKFVIGTFQEFERELGSELGGLYSVKATIEYVSNRKRFFFFWKRHNYSNKCTSSNF